MSRRQINTVPVVLFTLLLSTAMVSAQGPQMLSSGGCVVGAGYDPNCDVNHDNRIDVQDLEIVASNWRGEGTWICSCAENSLTCSDCDSRFVNVSGDSMAGSSDLAVLQVTNTRTGAGAGVKGKADVIGVIGEGGAIGVSGDGNLFGLEGDGDLFGVIATSSDGYGVYGKSFSTSGRGVYGLASANNGQTFGIYGQSDSTSGKGVYGFASALSGKTYGVYGEAASPSGSGVYGYASATSGGTQGVSGVSDSTAGTGVWGYASADTSDTWGVYGTTRSSEGRGVSGYASDAFGYTYGVRGRADSIHGKGVAGWAHSSSGVNFGVWGETNSPDGYGVFSYGDFGATGTKSALVETTSFGIRKLYTIESPEVWAEDFGTATLLEGKAKVIIDPIFAETVRLSDGSYHVFLTPISQEPVALFVTDKTATYFVVQGTKSNGDPAQVDFDYRIIAKRLGYEDLRLETVSETALVSMAHSKGEQNRD